MKKLLLVTLALVLAGCSGKPSEGVIKEQVTAKLLADGNDQVYEVNNFKKINGIPQDDNNYIAEVAYDLRFKVDLEDAGDALQSKSSNVFAGGLKAMALGVKYGPFKAGDMLHFEEKIPFIRTDNGWQVKDDN